MGYKSKFKGAEIDARLEKMVNVTYAELKALRDEGKLIAGQMYRMTDYETTCTWADTQVAGHPFDLVLTALDNKTLDEKCSAIWSARDKDGYFANSNLTAWDVRYCLDNDKTRFGWAQKGGKTLTADLSPLGLSNFSAYLDGTFELDGTTYTKWNGGVLNGATIYFLTLNETPKYGDSILLYIVEARAVVGESLFVSLQTNTAGKGVIYRLIDEAKNDVSYDFKNIMFKRPLTNGKYDAENGVDTFCYTFCCIDGDTYAIEDQSVREPQCCCNNKFAVDCFDNVFLTFSGNNCYSNTFGDNCSSNTFGDNCAHNTFGDKCSSNTFGDNCGDNTFGDNCHSCTFGDDCFGNTFDYGCYANTFGDNCVFNTFGANCYESTFGDKCSDNTLGHDCNEVIFGVECRNNTFGNSCPENTFGDYFSYNILGAQCKYNIFKNEETAAYYSTVRYYNLTYVSSKEIDVKRGRKYTTFIKEDSSDSVIEHTVEYIVS